MKNFTYVNPSSVEEASELLKQPGTVVMGGGTDLLGVLKDGLLPEYPEKVVSLKKLPEWIRSEKKKTVCYWGRGNSASDRRFCSSTGWLECPG